MLIRFFPEIDYCFEKIAHFFMYEMLCVAHCGMPPLAYLPLLLLCTVKTSAFGEHSYATDNGGNVECIVHHLSPA